MPLSRSRDYLSIGEVLDAIRPDFPDVSISKIRFLEAEGLINPERTSSGYRKFYESDVARLRYILSLQKDQFLPLKVIRQRLAAADGNGKPLTVEPPAVVPGAPAAPAPARTPAAETDVHLSRDEFLKASGLEAPELSGLEEFGILPARDGEPYDGDDLVIARAAKKMFGYGVEARHLRMYKQFAERQTSFFGQILSPVAHRGDDASSAEAARSMKELAALSRQLHDAALRSSLRELL